MPLRVLQCRAGQLVQLLPEQQCERVERVDLLLQRRLLRHRQRLWLDLQQYVQLLCLNQSSPLAERLTRGTCTISGCSVRRQHLHRVLGRHSVLGLSVRQHERFWRNVVHMHDRLLDLWQRSVACVLRYVAKAGGTSKSRGAVGAAHPSCGRHCACPVHFQQAARLAPTARTEQRVLVSIATPLVFRPCLLCSRLCSRP